MARKKNPKPSAETTASPVPRAAPRRRSSPTTSSREASTTPASARAIPAACTAVGRSPVAIPTTTGTTAAQAEIGATTPMFPIASAR